MSEAGPHDFRIKRSPSPERSRMENTDVEPMGPEAKMLQGLLIFGWIVVLLYFPSGLLHGTLGAVVYARDLLLGIHLLMSLIFLLKRNHLNWFAAHSWVILITPILLIPAVIDSRFTLEALRTCKWSVCWLDWIVMGHLFRLNKNWGSWFKILIGISVVMMVVELIAGAVEWHTGNYLFPTTWGETTALGVQEGNDQALQGQMRIRGLQRDVFSFANVMAMNAVAGMACLTILRNQALRIVSAVWILAFGFMMVISGGRSALFGGFAAFIYTAFLLGLPVLARKYGRSYVLAWLIIAALLSMIGVGKFTDFVGETVLGGSYVGNADSAFMRDSFWVKMFSDFLHQPLILVIGGPFASILDSHIDVMFHWADNQLLWNTYHTGLAGSLAILFFFYKILEPDPQEPYQGARQALILFLVFVLGEGIARESMTFIGCLPLFVLCGYDSACDMMNRRSAFAGSPFRTLRRSQGGAR